MVRGGGKPIRRNFFATIKADKNVHSLFFAEKTGPNSGSKKGQKYINKSYKQNECEYI
jgi:hypothetical protein